MSELVCSVFVCFLIIESSKYYACKYVLIINTKIWYWMMIKKLFIQTSWNCATGVACKLRLKYVGQETIVHGLFGGLQKRERHKKYVINLSNIDNIFNCTLNVMEQKIFVHRFQNWEMQK